MRYLFKQSKRKDYEVLNFNNIITWYRNRLFRIYDLGDNFCGNPINENFYNFLSV